MVRIAYGAGHGGGGSTRGKRAPDGEYEWNFNNKVVQALEAELRTYENVELLRTDDSTGTVDVPLAARTERARNWGCDIYVSVHHNVLGTNWGNHSGVETYTYLGSQPRSERLARAVHPRIVRAMSIRDRGMKKENFHVVRAFKDLPVAAVLTEGGFMDSTIDSKKLRDDSIMRAQGTAIACGIAEYAGLKKKAASLTNSPFAAFGRFRIYTGTFKDDAEAEKYAKLIENRLGYQPFVQDRRIWTGVFQTFESAQEAQRKIRGEFGLNPSVREE